MARRSLFAIIALALLACIVWLVLPKGDAGQGDIVGATAAGVESDAAERVADDLVSAQEASATPVAAAGLDEQREAVAAEAEEVAQPELARTAGVFASGRVVDAAGRGVAGAEIKLRGAGPMLIRMGGSQPSATTDDSGVFRMPLTPGDAFNVVAKADGFAPLTKEGLVRPASGDLEVGTLALTAGAVLYGRVLDAAGQPVEGARLNLSQRRGGMQFSVIGFGEIDGVEHSDAVTDALGRFELKRLAVGPWSVRVDSDEHPSKSFEGLTERAGRIDEELVLQLPRAATIRGTVAGIPADADSDFAVRANLASDGNFGFFGSNKRGAVEANGTFEIKALEAGKSYELVLYRDDDSRDFGGSNGARSEAVRAEAGESAARLEYRRGSSLAFRVVDDATSEPIEDFEASVGSRWDSRRLKSSTDGDVPFPGGLAEFDDLDTTGAIDFGGGTSLTIRAAGFTDFVVDDLELEPGIRTDLGTLRLQPADALRVVVVDLESGEPLKGVRVTLSKADALGFGIAIDADTGVEPAGFNSGGTRRERTGGDGVAELTGFGDVECRLEVERSGFAPFSIDGLVVPTGGAERLVELGRGGRVEVAVFDSEGEPAAGVSIEHRAPNQAGGPLGFGFGEPSTRTQSDGVAVFDNLAPGTHGFAIGGADNGFAVLARSVAVRVEGDVEESSDDRFTDVDVDHGTQERIELTQAREFALFGELMEAGTPLVGASIQVREKNEDVGNMARSMMFGGGESVMTDATGAWRVEGKQPGSYEIVVEHPRRAMSHVQAVEVVSSDERVDIDLDVTIVEGRVLDAAGDPVVGATVSAERAQGSSGTRIMQTVFISAGGSGGSVQVGNGAGGGESLTDDKGRYELRGVASGTPIKIKAEPPGTMPFADSASSDSLELPAGATRKGIDLTLDSGGALRVKLFDDDGQPTGFQLVTARPAGSEAGIPETLFIDASGEGVLRGMAPGAWDLEIRKLGPDAAEPLERQVEITEGEEELLEVTV